MAKKQPVKPTRAPATPAPETPPTPGTEPNEAASTPTPGTEPNETSTTTTPTPETPGKKVKAKAKPKPARRGQGVWGIDLGQCSLKAVRLEEIDGVVTVTAFDYIEHPKILSQPDADRDGLIREALEKFLANNNHLKGDLVAISVPGQSALARFVKLPPVQADKIADIVKFEAKQQIPFNLDEVIWDYQKVHEGEVMEGGLAMDTEIGLFAMKRDAINTALQHFKDVGVEVDYVQIAPLALCNYLTFDALGKTPGEADAESSPGGCIVALDMGADSTNLVITDGKRIIWQKVISTGGNHFTRALTKDLKLTFAKAEHTKRNAAKSPDLKKILAALKPVLNDFEGELKRSLNYFQNTHKSAELKYIVGMGNAFRLPGLQKFLEEKLGLPVKRLQKFERLKGDAVVNAPVFQENLGTFTTAYGLALQGLKKSRLTTNLLPPELRTERMIRAKKPWAVAAAAVLMLGLASAAAGYALDYQTYADPKLATAISSANSVKQQAQQIDTDFNTEKTNALAEEEGVKSVVAGQKEHTNWLKLLHFISTEVVPRPDGTNLSAEARAKYFENAYVDTARMDKPMSGREAYALWLKRQGSFKTAPLPTETPMGPGFPGPGLPGPGQPGPGFPGPGQPGTGTTPTEDDLGPGTSDLVQINVEGIDCRYSTNLEAVWNSLKTNVKDADRFRPASAYTEPPKLGAEALNKGWIVEVRGYTFHAGQRTFVLDTLCENIARKGRPDLDKKPAQPAPMQPGEPMPEPMPGAEEKPALPDKGPVKNRLTHVVLYSWEADTTSDTTTFNSIGATALDNLLKATTNPAGGGMPGTGTGTGPMPGPVMPGPGMPEGGGTGGATANPRDSWLPVGSGAAGSGGMGMPGPGMPGPGGPRPYVPPGTGTGTGPGMGPGTGTTGTPSKYTRTEFVVLFIWSEPTPSDALRGQTEEAGGTDPLAAPQ